MTRIVRHCSTATVAALLLALGGLGGCGSGEGSQRSPGPGGVASTPSSAPPPTEVASITAYGRKVTFFSAPPDVQTMLGIKEMGSAYDDRPLVGTLLKTQKLTSQEIYLALAPAGATAPPALVAVQAQEAAAIGRSSDEVLHVAVPSELTQKNWTSLAQCASTIQSAEGNDYLSWYSGGYYTVDPSSGPFLEYPSDTQCEYTTGEITMGACNSGSNEISWSEEEFYGNNCGSNYVIDSGTDLPSGWYVYYYWSNSGGADYSETATEIGGTTDSFYMLYGGI